MCGIAVAVDWPEAEDVVARLLSGIRHRGDVNDPVVSPRRRTAMGTRRLRIVDAALAIQPQFSFDGRLAVSFNGEIYNHAALRTELAAQGVRFVTQSDTEVLANALRIWGVDALRRLNGMYAFVALDLRSGEFLAARDPYGVKPLYVMQADGGFLFCSEIRPLLETVEHGDVLMLPPGHALNRAGCGRYPSALQETRDEMAGDSAALDRLLAEAVHLRMPSDLPAAVLFSGGIDSTLVAHYARQIRTETPGYFVGSTRAPDFRYAADYAAQTGFDLRIVPFDPESDAVFDKIGETIAVCESFEPNLVRGAVCGLMAAERMQADGFRVGLCGEGADELLCGYPPLEIAFQAGDPSARALREEVLGLMHCVSLQRVDRTSMHCGVEMREPFLDPAVANYALALAPSALVREANDLAVGKMPLRGLYDLYPDDLPTSIRDRGKVPFGEGSGLAVSSEDSAWKRRFEAEISDSDFREGRLEFAEFRLQSKEELYYIRKLAQALDVRRVPHLRERAWISFSLAQHSEKLKAYAYASL